MFELNLSDYVLRRDSEEFLYLFNMKNNLSMKLDKRLLYKSSIFSDLEKALERYRFNSEENEVTNIISQFKQEDTEVLDITIFVHGDCNFRCEYCYEKFVNTSVSAEAENKIINFVESRLKIGNFKILYISWFGGEPLLGLKKIYSISQRLKLLADEYKVDYQAGATTNGYLLNRFVFPKLLTCDVRFYQITIDGEKEAHDFQRKLKNGSGSFDRIIENLKNMQNTDEKFSVSIRFNV